VKSGAADVALALGFERMAPGSLSTNYPDRPSPLATFHLMMHELEDTKLGQNHGPSAPRLFSNGAQEYFDKYGANVNHLAQIGKFTHR
jgi:sterol carrier protein 2